MTDAVRAASPAGDPGPPRWMAFRGLAGVRLEGLGPDVLAGVTLAAVAIPEQMATARLAGLPPQTGFFAFIAATLAFLALGSSRRLSAGADSTIAPIFAGGLAVIASSGTPQFAALAAALALMVGAVVLVAGVFRLGWIGNLLSIPVMTGFLAGIAVHIVVSQAPAALGLTSPDGALPRRILRLASMIPQANLACVAVAGGVLALTAAAHRLSPRLPGPLLAVVLASLATAGFGLERRGVGLLGRVTVGAPHIAWPGLSPEEALRLAPLALMVALVVMVQTAAVTRSFPATGEQPDANRDFIGLGAAGLLAGLVGAFPVNASPPRTAIVAESGGRSQLTGLVAVAIVVAILAWWSGALGFVPQAALAGVLFFVAARLVRVEQILAVVRASPAESLLILTTAGGIVVLPIEDGVALGIGLSLFNGLWASARVRLRPMGRIPGSTVWWPLLAGGKADATAEPDVAVLAFAAPLTFLNADAFAREFVAAVRPGQSPVGLAILEAAGMVEIDFTGAQALTRVVQACRQGDIIFAVARLESVAAQEAFGRLGLRALIGGDRIFESVAKAVETLRPHAAAPNAAAR